MYNSCLWAMIYFQGHAWSQMLLFNGLLFEVITQTHSGNLCLRLLVHVK